MNKPPTRHVTTVDGVDIAFWTMGAGEPLVYMSAWPFENIGLELERPVDVLLYEHLARERMLVRFDGRGVGNSDRNAADLSLTARVLDLAAVVGQMKTRPIALVGFSTSSPVAIVFAARHPELVSRLVLYDAHAEMHSLSSDAQTQAILGLMKANWQLFTETLANMGYGFSSAERAREYAAFIRGCTTQDVAVRAMEEMAQIDVRHLLPELKMPVLVLQHREMPYDGPATAQALAAAIPGAKLVLLDGSYATDPGAERGPIAEFLGAPPLDLDQTRMVTVLFTDIVDSTRLTQRLGDHGAQELIRLHDAIVRDALRANYGTEVKHMGDGIMASFLSPERGLGAAVQIQRDVARYNASAKIPLDLRVGVNTGQALAENDDLFGSAVQLAARVCRAAAGGEIIVTDRVRALGGSEFAFTDKGPATLRGFEEPIPLFAVEWVSTG